MLWLSWQDTFMHSFQLNDFIILAGGHVKRNRIATAFHKCAAAEEEVTQTTDTVVRLAELQDFGGFWNMDKKLSELLNLTTGQMSSTRPSEVKDDRMWATALVIAYLQVRMPDRREEWEMMVQKATDWLQMEHNWTDASPLLGDAEKALAKLLPSQ
uniref:Rubis-subs-bind domain-containing protein n=1 Tax=Mesocestoides corti TaxID=53468 RepID=A0A5K3G0P7_MESCO